MPIVQQYMRLNEMFVINNLILILAILIFSSCATLTKKSDMGYMEGTLEINDGESKDIQLQIERMLYKLKNDPKNWKLMNNLLVLYRLKGNHQTAIDYGREILHNDTKNYIALSNLAMVYYDLNNYDYALYLLKKAQSIYDLDPSAHLNLGLVFLKRNEDQLAEDEFLQAYKLKKDFYPAIRNLAYYYFEVRNHSKAIPFLEKVVIKENTMEHLNMLAMSYRFEERYEEAYKLYKKVLIMDSKNKIALYNSAIIELEYLSKPSLALEKFKLIKKELTEEEGKEYETQVNEYINRAMSFKMIEENS